MLDATLFINQINDLAASREKFFFLIDFEKENFLIRTPETLREKKDVFFRFPNGKFPVSSREVHAEPVLFHTMPPFSVYAEKFQKVKHHLLRGDTYLLNLSMKIPVEQSGTLEDVFYKAHAPYKVYMPGKFVCFSPETFVKIKGNYIYTYPMKGTSAVKEDLHGDKLMHNKKELFEHYTIVDLLRNDLAMVATQVEVVRFRYPEKIITYRGKIWQTSSEIRGRLPDDWKEKWGNILWKILPAGSVSGAPKIRTLEIIGDAEGESRGFYTGIAGFFDGENLETAVLIRFIEEENGKYYYRSGGGITHHSKAIDEYNEIQNKIYIPIA